VLATASAGGKPFVVRTSWLFGENGPNFVRTMVGLMKQKQELRVVADQHGRPTYTHDLALATLALLGIGRTPRASSAAPGVYHFANAGATTWHAFTVGIRDALLARKVPLAVERIVPVTTAEFPRPAPRPAYSVLGTARIEAALGRAPRPWTEALDNYLATES
jgi:dTDP-4-dehydrorhamnose reductase